VQQVGKQDYHYIRMHGQQNIKKKLYSELQSIWMWGSVCWERDINFQGTCCPILEVKDGGNRVLRNVGVCLPNYTLSLTRRSRGLSINSRQKIQTHILRHVWRQDLCVRGSAVGWDTGLKAERSRVRFLMGGLWIFIDIFLPAATWPRRRLSRKQKWVSGNEYQEYLLGGKGGRSVRLTSQPSCANCLVILGASTTCSPNGLSRAVQG